MSQLSDPEVALAAAQAGAAIVRAAFGGRVTRHAKSDLDFATNADADAEQAAFDVITSARPMDGLVGEESGVIGSERPRRWLVDPLCGTQNFAAQTPGLAVNVALVHHSRVIAAASADPLANEVFWTDAERAWLRTDGRDQELRPSSTSALVEVNCDGPIDGRFVGPQLPADPAFRRAFGPRVFSTTLAAAWVAAGRRAAYVSDGTFIDNVHFAAGIAVCQRAGCVVTDFSGQPLHSGRGLIIAADDRTRTALVDIVRPHLEAVLS